MELLIQPNPVALSLLIPATICGALALYALLSRPVTGSRAFIVLMLAVFIWSVAYGLELSSLKLEQIFFFRVIGYIGIVGIAPIWLILTLLYTGRGKWVVGRIIILLFVIPLITLVLVATDRLHHLYYSTIEVDTGYQFPLLSITPGPWYIVFFIYTYACLLLGTLWLLLKVRHPAAMFRGQVIAMLIGVSVPLIVNILYVVFKLKPMEHLDLTPFALTITGIALAWGIFRQRLFDVAPVARDLVIENMGEAMVVLDMQDRIVDSNPSAQRTFGWNQPPYGQPANKMWQEWPYLLDLINSHRGDRTELVHSSGDTKQYYEVNLSELGDRQGLRLGWLLLLHDITIRRRAQEALRLQEEKYQVFFKTSRDATFITSVDGRWLDVNDAAAEMFGYENAEELKNNPVIDIYDDKKRRKEYIDHVSLHGFAQDFPAVFRKRNGDIMDVLITAVAIRDREGNITAYQGTIKDISEIKRTEAALLLANERLTVLLADTERRNHEITLLGEMAQWIHASKDLEMAYGGAARYLGDLFAGDCGTIAEVNQQSQMVEVKASFGSPQGERVFKIQDCLTLRKGQVYEYDGSGSSEVCPHLGVFRGFYISMPLIVPGESSWILNIQYANDPEDSSLTGKEWLELRRSLMVSVGQELSLAFTNVRLRENLREQTIRDPLTGLYNRRYMEEMSARELYRAIRNGKGVGFIMGDIDHFKDFNDKYGHEVGDLLLKSVSNLLRASIRVEDIACRYGGEEFLIILPSASLQDAYKRALKIHGEVEKITFEHNNQRIGNVTISLGVSAFPEQGDTASELIAAADLAMYKAKREGRNRVCLP